jgi:hypothetical protein
MTTDVAAKIQAAYELAKAVATAPAKFKAAKLELQMADLLTSLAEATSDALADKETIRELRAALATEAEMVLRDGVYWRVRPDGKDDGPYCGGCYGGDHRSIPLAKLRPPYSEAGQYECPRCKALA